MIYTKTGKHHKANLKATFGGFRFAPKWYAYGSNSITQKFILWPDHIECRAVFLTQNFTFDKVRMIDVLTWRKNTHNIHIIRDDSIFTFAGNFIHAGDRKLFLERLKDKGCPLSERAQKIIDEWGQ